MVDRPSSRFSSLSETAALTAGIRAIETSRPRGTVRDPLAMRLAGTRGLDLARRASLPVRIGVVSRTIILDRMIQAAIDRGCRSIVNLGAGYDTRPYRLNVGPDVRWVEADRPEIIEAKETRLADEPCMCSLQRVSLDVTDGAALRKIVEKIADGDRAPLFLTEGLVQYLDAAGVETLAQTLSNAGPGALWVTDVLWSSRFARRAGGAHSLAAGGQAFVPDRGGRCFAAAGWYESDYVDYFWDVDRYGTDTRVSRLTRSFISCLPASRALGFRRGAGVLVLARRESAARTASLAETSGTGTIDS